MLWIPPCSAVHGETADTWLAFPKHISSEWHCIQEEADWVLQPKAQSHPKEHYTRKHSSLVKNQVLAKPGNSHLKSRHPKILLGRDIIWETKEEQATPNNSPPDNNPWSCAGEETSTPQTDSQVIISQPSSSATAIPARSPIMTQTRTKTEIHPPSRFQA